MSKQEELIKLLIENKLLTEEQAVEIGNTAKVTKGSLEEILIKKNLVDLEKITQIKAQIYNLPYQSLSGENIKNEVLNIIPLEAAENYKIVCFDKAGNKIKVGITDPEDFKAVEAVNFLAKEGKMEVEYYLISKSSFSLVFDQYKNFEKEISTALERKAEEEEESQEKEFEGEKGLDEVIKSAPVSKIVSVIIRHAVEGKASDIHIEPWADEVRVRYRIDGILHTTLVLPRNVHSSIVSRIKVLASMKLDEKRLPQDGRIRLTVNNKEIDFRVSTLPLSGEEKVVMRILDTTEGPPSLEKLGYFGRAKKVILDNIKRSGGIFIVAGPTGSGKSTTLFAVLNLLNKDEVNISTLEDPIEYFIKGVNQAQIRPKIGFSFANGLRSLLRQDPDIIMVGEIRDNETAELAIHAGLTGHFVLSTLHTNSAIGTVPRLLDMGVEPFLLGSTLNVVIAQRLVRRICKHCKEEEKLPEDLLAYIESKIKDIPKELFDEEMKDLNSSEEAGAPSSIENKIFYRGKGCKHCGGTGYSGRIAIVEVLDIDKKIKEIIMDKSKILKFDDFKKSQNFITIEQDGIMKVLQGVTTVEEVLRVAKS